MSFHGLTGSHLNGNVDLWTDGVSDKASFKSPRIKVCKTTIVFIRGEAGSLNQARLKWPQVCFEGRLSGALFCSKMASGVP